MKPDQEQVKGGRGSHQRGLARRAKAPSPIEQYFHSARGARRQTPSRPRVRNASMQRAGGGDRANVRRRPTPLGGPSPAEMGKRRSIASANIAVNNESTLDQFVDVLAELPNIDVCHDPLSLLRCLRSNVSVLAIRLRNAGARNNAHDSAIKLAAYAIRLAQSLAC